MDTGISLRVSGMPSSISSVSRCMSGLLAVASLTRSHVTDPSIPVASPCVSSSESASSGSWVLIKSSASG